MRTVREGAGGGVRDRTKRGTPQVWRGVLATAGAWFLVAAFAVAQGLGSRIEPRWRRVVARPEGGMATAEYAIVTLAAVAFGGLLLVILRGAEVREMLLGIIREALSR